MRILELSLRNYRVFEEVDLELPARVIGIFGPNGSGKSSLVESVAFGLYGRTRTDKAQIRTNGILTDCAVRLVFEHGGRQYEVRRTIRGRNHQTDAELFMGDAQLAAGVTEVDEAIERLLHMDLPVFRASVFAEQKQLDAFSEVTKGKRKEMVLRLLGIRPVDEARTVARKEARQAKQDADRLAEKLPDVTERESALEVGRARVAATTEAAKVAAERLAEAERRAADAAEAWETSDTVRQRVERLEVELRAATESAEAAEERRAELETRAQRLRAAVDERPALEEEQARLVQAPKLLAAAEKALEASEEVAALQEKAGALEEVDGAAALAALEDAEAERETAREEAARARSGDERARQVLAEAEAALERATEADPTQPCPTCGRPLGEDFSEYLRHCREAVRDAKKIAKEMAQRARTAARDAQATDRVFRDAAKRGESVQARLAERASVSERLEERRAKVANLLRPWEGVPPDLPALRADADRATEVAARLATLRSDAERLADTQRDLEACATEATKARRKIERSTKEIGGLGFDPEEHARLAKERVEARRLLDEARRSERAASDERRDAVAVVDRLTAEIRMAREQGAKIADLRDEARLLDRVSVLLEGFRTFLYGRIMPQLSRDAEALFREVTNHEYEDLRIDEDTLAIEIADAGRYFPIERFSGSETDLANLALRVAISTHLSRVSGADVGMMVLDEVLASLDAERKDLFVAAIGRLSQRFHQLFVITHAEQVKDQFPASIEVRKVGRRRSTATLV